MSEEYAPTSAEDARAWVSARLASRSAFVIRGRGARAGPAQRDALTTSALRSVRFFHPDDMVIGVEAGLPFQRLNEILAERGMRLTVNPWFRAATIGGMAAANDFGPDRLFGGGLRDAIIGIEYINGKGNLVKAGGRVVKNVSGYDLCRMMLGSLGGLGVMTALNFKVLPAPIAPHGLFSWEKTLDWRKPLAEGVIRRKLPLDWLQVLADQRGWRLGLGISGNTPRRNRLLREWRSVFGDRLEMARDGEEPDGFSHLSAAVRFSGFLQPIRDRLPAPYIHLHGMAPTRAFFEEDRLVDMLRRSVEREGAVLALHPLGGDFHLFMQEGQKTASAMRALAEILAAMSGYLVLERSSPGFLKTPWVRPLPPSFAAMRALKSSLDPAAIFYAPFYEMDPS